jgi:hypothetical protein
MNSIQNQNLGLKNDFKSKSKITLVISNRDFKSFDFKSSPSLQTSDQDVPRLFPSNPTRHMASYDQ